MHDDLTDIQNQVLNTQTQLRGSNDAEYQIYVACAGDLGWPIKSYDEWVSS